MEQRKYDLEDRLIEYASKISDIVDTLPNTRLGNYLAGQMIRSGTSPALNYGEAQSAESQADFIHKMKVCLKELRETFIGLKLVKRKTMVDKSNLLENIMIENNELISIFVTSIKTAKNNKNRI
ncbi:MAG: four helix bundle protein [Melioribacteraceae bacterium]|nr:four helix bundle protein [Melioribacteraceae bacterium]